MTYLTYCRVASQFTVCDASAAFSILAENSNGHTLIELCEEKKLFVSNSAFDHPSRHQTTWIGQIRDRTTGKIINIFNQIDYILCQKRNKHLLTNARSYAGTLLTSDHKLVKASFKLEKHKLRRKEQHSKRTPKPNIAAIVNKEESQRRYQNTLDTKLSSITSDRQRNAHIQLLLPPDKRAHPTCHEHQRALHGGRRFQQPLTQLGLYCTRRQRRGS